MQSALSPPQRPFLGAGFRALAILWRYHTIPRPTEIGLKWLALIGPSARPTGGWNKVKALLRPLDKQVNDGIIYLSQRLTVKVNAVREVPRKSLRSPQAKWYKSMKVDNILRVWDLNSDRDS
jgi:hypothetical protein